MKLLKTSKIALIVALSLPACAGSPPKMERPIELFNGTPERNAICRNDKKDFIQWVLSLAQREETKPHAERMLTAALADPKGVECLDARDPKFAEFFALHADDLRVLLQYQENLLYSCEKWKQ